MNDTKLLQIKDYLDRSRGLSPALIDAEGHVSRGNAHFALGEYPAALEEFNAAIRQRADYVNAHFNAGVVLAAMGRPEEAEVAFRSAIGLSEAQDVTLPEAYHYLAVVLRDQGRLADALSAAKVASERTSDPNFAYLRAELEAEAGNANDALVWLRRAVSTAPKYKATAREDKAFSALQLNEQFVELTQ